MYSTCIITRNREPETATKLWANAAGLRKVYVREGICNIC